MHGQQNIKKKNTESFLCCNSTQFTAAPSASTNMGWRNRSTILSAVLYCVKIRLSYAGK